MTEVRRHMRIPDAEWESHKESIKKLYIDDRRRLEGENGVINLMRSQHGFRASKAQYETRFKKWGFRKYFKKEEWMAISKVCNRNRRDGVSSRVYFFGELVADEKVQKETTRYRCGPIIDTVRDEPLPEGISILDVNRNGILETDAEASHTEASATSVMELALTRQTSRCRSPISNTALFSSWNSSTMDFFHIPSRPPSPIVLPDNDEWRFGDHITQVFNLEPTLSYWTNASVFIPRDTLSLTEKHCSTLISTLGGTGGWALDTVRSCTRNVRPLLSSSIQTSLQRKGSEELMVTLIIHLLMNNLVESEGIASTDLFRHLQYFNVHQAQNLLGSIPQPYSTALQQSILTLAIDFNAVAIVRILLDQGLDMNQILCQHRGLTYEPIVLASKHRHTEIVQLIIDSGEKVTPNICSLAVGEMLESMYTMSAYDERLVTQSVNEILTLLLQAGADIHKIVLSYSIFWEHEEWVDTLIIHSQTPQNPEVTSLLLDNLEAATRYLDSVRAFQIMKISLGHRLDIPVDLHGANKISHLQSVLQLACFRGHNQSVSFLLECNLQPTAACLAEAVRGNCVDIVHLLLEAGVWPHSVVTYYNDRRNIFQRYSLKFPVDIEPHLGHGGDFERKFETTPFAQAIRWHHADLISLFVDMGAIETIFEDQGKWVAFRAELEACSEVGSIPMIKVILGKANEAMLSTNINIIGRMSPKCLSLAAIGGYEDVFTLLLDAGFRPDFHAISDAITGRNATILRLCLDTGLAPRLGSKPYLVWLAVQWGNIDVVRDLIVAGAPFTGHLTQIPLLGTFVSLRGCQTTPLSEALLRQDYAMYRVLLELEAEKTSVKNYSKIHSPLKIAVELGNFHIVQELLSRGADPNDPEALLAAASNAPELAGAILESFDRRYLGAKRQVGNKALDYAISSNNLDLVRFFARYADVNSLNQEGQSHLSMPDHDKWHSLFGKSICSHNQQIIEIVHQAGGDLNSTVRLDHKNYNRLGRWTALLEAINTKNLLIVKTICKAGANVNLPASLGILRTPLQLAVELGHIEIVQFLLDHGSEVNADPCIFGGGTAMQLAAINGYVRLAELLLENGAEINAPRGRFLGRTAFEGAAEHGRMDMLLFLYHNGVDLVSDGGEQIRRATDLATRNGQLATKCLVEQISQSIATSLFIT